MFGGTTREAAKKLFANKTALMRKEGSVSAKRLVYHHLVLLAKYSLQLTTVCAA